MSYASNFNLNWRVSYLESVISSIIPYLPPTLSNVLLAGNTADNSIVLTDGQNVSTSTKGGLSLVGNNPAPNTYTIDIDNAYALGVPTITLTDNPSSSFSALNTSTGLVLNNGGLTTTYGNGLIDVTGVGMSIIAPNTNIYLGDVNGTANSTAIAIDDVAKTINLTTDNGTIGGYCNIFQVGDVNGNINSTSVKLDDGNGKVEIQAKDNVKLGDYLGIDTGTNLLIDCANASTTFFTPNNFLVQTNSFNVDNQQVSTIGDVDNNSSKTKIIVNASTQNIDIDLGGGNGSSGMILRMGDINNTLNSTKIILDDVKRYQTIFAGRMSNMDEVNNTIGNHAELYSNFFTTDVNMRMYPVTDYLNPLTPNGEGWFCYICNVNSSDINVTADDGLLFVSRHSGGFTATGNIGKYTTARLTLSYHSSVAGGFFWSILAGD